MGPIWVLKQQYCQNMFYPIFSLYTKVTSCTKSEKFNAPICYKETHFGLVFVQKLQCNIFCKKITWVNFNPLSCCNSMQKNRKYHPCIDFSQNLQNILEYALALDNTEKPHSEPIFSSLLTQKLQNKAIPKNIISIIFNSLSCCNFIQKNQKSSMYWLLITFNDF